MDLFLSVLASSLIFVLFRSFPGWKIDTLQAVIANYFVAFACGIFLFHDHIPASDAASEYYDAGIVPWQYRLLPAPVADLVIPIAVTGSVLLILAALYQILLPEFYTVWKEIIRPRRHHRRQRRVRHGSLPDE